MTYSSISRSSTSTFIASSIADWTDVDRRTHLCGFDLNLTYPQHGHFPTLNLTPETISSDSQRLRKKDLLTSALAVDAHMKASGLEKGSLDSGNRRLQKRDQWKRELTGRANGTIDPWSGCDLYDEMIDYALNFSIPWSMSFIPICHLW